MKPVIVAVGGFSSDSGKTTLVCELLRALPGWEAIKMTRGHYRSCGRDPHACCVSPLLGEEPLVLSGREATYAAGKDTGRYWEAGAANVHWVVSTDAQVAQGFAEALARVSAEGVLVEGNSFLRHADADFAIMVARPDRPRVKPSARRVLAKASVLYVSQADGGLGPDDVGDLLRELKEKEGAGELAASSAVYTRGTFPQLVERIRAARVFKEGAARQAV